jgi:hypothetical protein
MAFDDTGSNDSRPTGTSVSSDRQSQRRIGAGMTKTFVPSRALPGYTSRVKTVIAIAVASAMIVGCAASRDLGEGRPITDYSYAVVGDEATDGWHAEAESVLAGSFILLPDDDPRLEQPNVIKNACVVVVNSHRGFWSTSASVEMQDFRTRRMIISSQVRGGGLYAGAHSDVLNALKDIAQAKGPRGPEPAPVSVPDPTSAQNAGQARSKAERLSEVADLRARGLITESEYSAQRRAIIAER